MHVLTDRVTGATELSALSIFLPLMTKDGAKVAV